MAEPSAVLDFEAELEALAQVEVFEEELRLFAQKRVVNSAESVKKSRKAHSDRKELLKSDLKKSTAFVKKLKVSINAEGIQQCIRDVDSLNLFLFISEIVSSIAATTFKATETAGIVSLCACLHQRYEEFTSALVSSLVHTLLAPLQEDDNEAGKRKRIQIRFIIELFQAGIFVEETFFCRLVRNLLGKQTQQSTTPPKENAPVDLLGMVTFVKYACETLIGIPPKKLALLKASMPSLETLPIKVFTSVAVCKELHSMVFNAYDNLCEDLVQAHYIYRKKEMKMEKDKLLHGSITEQKQTELDNSKRLYEKLLSVARSLSECLQTKMPDLAVAKEESDENIGISVWDASSANQSLNEAGGLYCDEETRSFYEVLPDLLSTVPLSTLGLSAEQAQALQEKEAAKRAREDSAEEVDRQEDKDAEEAMTSEAEQLSLDESAAATSAAADADKDEPGEVVDESRTARLATLLDEKLLDASNKKRADEFAVAFCYLNGCVLLE